MICFRPHTLLAGIVQEMYRRARHCTYTGTESNVNKRAINHCTATFVADWVDPAIGVIVIFTRDDEMHSGGMFRNPEFERCYHLSLSFRHALTGKPIPYCKNTAEEIVKAFFGDDVGKLWVESPKTPEGKANEVWHYRLLCDEHWKGFVPRKEVYSSEFTGLDWKSFSEIHGVPPPIMPGWGPA